MSVATPPRNLRLYLPLIIIILLVRLGLACVCVRDMVNTYKLKFIVCVIIFKVDFAELSFVRLGLALFTRDTHSTIIIINFTFASTESKWVRVRAR